MLGGRRYVKIVCIYPALFRLYFVINTRTAHHKAHRRHRTINVPACSYLFVCLYLIVSDCVSACLSIGLSTRPDCICNLKQVLRTPQPLFLPTSTSFGVQKMAEWHSLDIPVQTSFPRAVSLPHKNSRNPLWGVLFGVPRVRNPLAVLRHPLLPACMLPALDRFRPHFAWHGRRGSKSWGRCQNDLEDCLTRPEEEDEGQAEWLKNA